MTHKKESHTAKDQNIDDSDKTVLLSKIQSQTSHSQQNPVLTSDNSEETTKIHGTGSLLKNRFDLLEIIGSGGMGTVYKSLDKRDTEAGNSSFIAIKIINDQYKNNSNLLKALHSEARKTQALAHPNILTVYDFDRDGDTVFITMEFIDGVPLGKVIKAHPHGMSVNKALNIIVQMARALIYAHSKNIIHLDFKPNNVLLDIKNHLKVLDFGIARLSNSALSRGFDASVLEGLTPSYASLEMFNNETPDPRDDLYALACISYELLSGQHPFNKVSADIAQKKQLTPKKIKSLNSKQWNTLKQALAFNRKDGIKDVHTFLQGMTSTNDRTASVIITVIIASLATAFILNVSQFKIPVPLFSDKKQPPHASTEKNITPKKQSSANKPLLGDERAKTAIKESGNITIWTEKNNYQIGDKLQLSFTVDRPLHVKIAIINSEGKLSMLFPNPYQTTSYCKPNITYQIPPKNAEFTLDIDPPTGLDRIIAIGSSNPISDRALILDSAGKILDPKLRQSLVYNSITYTIN